MNKAPKADTVGDAIYRIVFLVSVFFVVDALACGDYWRAATVVAPFGVWTLYRGGLPELGDG